MVGSLCGQTNLLHLLLRKHFETDPNWTYGHIGQNYITFLGFLGSIARTKIDHISWAVHVLHS